MGLLLEPGHRKGRTSERDAVGTEGRAATLQLPVQMIFSQDVGDSLGISSSVYIASILMFFLIQDSDFMSVTGLLSGSVKRFSTMTRSGRDNRKLLCSVSAGLIVVFFILYYLVSKAGTWACCSAGFTEQKTRWLTDLFRAFLSLPVVESLRCPDSPSTLLFFPPASCHCSGWSQASL